MIEVTLSIRGPDNWLTVIGKQYPATITLMNWRKEDGGKGRELIRVEGMGDYEELFNSIKGRPEVCEVRFTRVDDGSALGVITTNTCAVCNTLEGTNCFLMDASVNENWITWKMLTSDRESLKSVFDRLKKQGFEVKLHRIKEVESTGPLTDKQEQILRIALIRGYFDYPKRISLRELAALFGISISTASEILRKGQKKVLMNFFRISDDEE